MHQLAVLAYCAAMGFVAAATISSFYRWVTAKEADFSLGKANPFGIALAVLLSMFAGPFIVTQKVVAGIRKQELRALPAIVGAVIAGMWSVCAGIFYVSFLINA